MRVTLDDLNPRVARSFQEKVRVLLEETPDEGRLTEPERQARALLLRDAAAAGGRTGPAFPLLVSVMLVGAYASMYFDSDIYAVALPAALGTLGFSTVCRTVWLGRAERLLPRRQVSAEALRAVFPLIVRTRAEDLYQDILLLLMDRETPLDEPLGRDTLRQLNVLLDNRFQIEAQRRRVENLIATTSLAGLEAERDELERKIAQTADALAGETLRDSAALCERRLQNARALLPMRERLDAQQEAIHQALASVHAALTRLQAATATLAALSMTDIQETVRRIESQTRAVEQAIEEVMALKVGG